MLLEGCAIIHFSWGGRLYGWHHWRIADADATNASGSTTSAAPNPNSAAVTTATVTNSDMQKFTCCRADTRPWFATFRSGAEHFVSMDCM